MFVMLMKVLLFQEMHYVDKVKEAVKDEECRSFGSSCWDRSRYQ